MKTNTITPDLRGKIDAYWRAANYLAVGQIYLYDNPLLRRPTITTPFDVTVLNELHRFDLVMDTITRLTQTGEKGIYLKQQLRDKLIEHKRYIDLHGENLPEIRNWKWKGAA